MKNLSPMSMIKGIKTINRNNFYQPGPTDSLIDSKGMSSGVLYSYNRTSYHPHLKHSIAPSDTNSNIESGK